MASKPCRKLDKEEKRRIKDAEKALRKLADARGGAKTEDEVAALREAMANLERESAHARQLASEEGEQ